MSFIHDKYINDFTPSREIKEGVLRWLWKSEIWNPVLDKNKNEKKKTRKRFTENPEWKPSVEPQGNAVNKENPRRCF